MTDNTDTLPELPFKDFVLKEIRDYWQEAHKPLLLSRIGQTAVAQRYPLPELLGGRKLTHFIKEEFGAEVVVEESEDSSSQFTARPRTDESAGDAQGAEAAPTAAGADPRLTRVLWAAFARPIAPGMERRIQLEPYVRFWDLAPPLNEVENRLPIAPEYVARPAEEIRSGRRDEVVLENIRRWMRDNNLDLSQFEEGATQKMQAARVSSTNPLLLLISSLDESERKRVQLPLDVIAKLLGK